MNSKPEAALRPRRLLVGSLAGLALLFGATGFARAQASEATIYTFKGGTDGAWPFGALVADVKGALYGTTMSGGSFNNYGTVFKLTPPASSGGHWTESVLYAFYGGPDGASPQSNLIFDKQGALYGVTSSGGNANDGTVFKLTPPASSGGQWTETVLYWFSGRADGARPFSGLVFDQEGALYGATLSGGTQGQGVVFKLTPPASGKGPWTETVLTDFAGTSISMPVYTLLFDAKGDLYGTTMKDGSDVGGSVFKLTPPPTSGNGKWTLTVLHRFSYSGAWEPAGGLIFGHDGAFYGTLAVGGSTANAGGVYRLQLP